MEARFMKIVLKTTNIKLTSELRDFVEEKINSLERFSKIFYDKKYFDSFFGKGKPKIEAWVEIGNTTLHHQRGPIFFAECQMKFPQKSIRARARRENLKQAITEIKDKLQEQLKQYKCKRKNLKK